MMRSAKKRQPKELEVSSLIDTSVPPNDWPIMQEFKARNEKK